MTRWGSANRSGRIRLTYANVMATVSVFIALGGGAYAVALAEKNSVTSKSIKKGAVRSADVKDNGLLGVDVKDESLTSADVIESTLEVSGQPGPPGPPGPTAAGVSIDSEAPPADPDLIPATATIVTPTSGRILVTLDGAELAGNCTAGTVDFGLYLDGVPLHNTHWDGFSGVPVDAHESAISPVVPAGEHEVAFGIDCPTGNVIAGSQEAMSMTALLVDG